MMKYLQKLGKSLMLPVACLPVASILMGIGYWIDPSGWGANNIIAAFLIKAGGSLIETWVYYLQLVLVSACLMTTMVQQDLQDLFHGL